MTANHFARPRAWLRRCIALITFACALSAAPSVAQLCAVPGKDGGSVTPVTLTGIVNTYYPSSTSVSAGGLLIPVDLPSPGGAPAVGLGDLLLVLQMQGASIDSSNTASYGDGAGGLTGRGFLAGTRTAGQHEFVVATGPLQTTGCPGGAARCLPVNGTGAGSGLVNAYSHRNTPSWDRYQVIRVPQYLSARVTSGLTALAWNGSVGGVLAVDVASTIDLNGATVSLDGLGFRGGGGRSIGGGTPGFSNADFVRASSVLYHASKGEGIAGTPRYVFDGTSSTDLGFDPYPGGGFSRGAPGSAGGGGNDWVSGNSNNSGGGAGANGGDGGKGGLSWSSAQDVGGLGGVGTVGTESSLLLLGGGGGAGTSNNAGPGHGGVGGGIAHLRADTFINAMTLRANGTQPPDSTQDGAGGGGAGGTISVGTCDPFMGSLTAVADGGDGGDVDWNVGDFHGPGGGGGGGVVLSTAALASTSVAAGSPGTSPTANTYGAVAGSAGDVDSSIAVAGPGASPGCICLATTALVTHPRLEVVDGIPHFAWSTASQAGTVGFEVLRSEAGDWRPVHRELVPATVAPARRADYRVADPGVPPAGVSRYLIVERDGQGRRIQHGPFSVRLDVARRAAADDAEWPLDRQVIPPAPSGGPEFEGRPKTLNLVGITGAAAYHLEIEQTGWYRLSAEALGELFGADSRRARRWIRNGQLALETSGESVAWTSDVGSTGLIFFGEGPESLPSAWAEVAPANAYRLTQTPGLVSSTANARPRSGARPPQTYLDVLEFEQQVFPGTVAAQDPEDDFWFWAGVAAGTSHDTAAVAFDVPNLATEGTSSLTVRLHGANRTGRTFDHRVEMTLNGNRLGTVSWAGFSHREAHFEIDSSWLLETGNTLQLQAQVVTDGEPSFVYLDGFSLKTHRLLEVHDPEQALRIDVTSARQVLEIGEVPDADTWVFDTRDPKRPVLQTADVVPAAGGLALRFQPRRRGSFWVVPSTALRTPAAIRPWRAPSLPLSSPTRRADLLLVTADALRPSADDWANYRRADGLEVEVLDLAQIEDSLTHGVRTPHAVRTLLAHAASWQLPPRFVLLLGDGHFDTQDHWGFGGNLIPPPLIRTDAGLYASDRWFLPVGPDAPSIGRLPATSNAQVRAALDKVKAFERQGRNLAALAVADNADAGGSFAADAENLLTLLPDGWQTRSIDLGAQSLGELRGDLLNAFGENLTWLQFFGHGGVDRFASEGILTTEDVATLPMGPTFPLVTALTCNAGRFELPGVASLAGELTLVPDRGAAAVLAPSALAFHSNSAAFGRLLTEALFQKPSAPKRLGEAQQQAERRFLQAGGSPDHLEVLHLFGDPAMRLPQ